MSLHRNEADKKAGRLSTVGEQGGTPSNPRGLTITNLKADLSKANSISINEFRLAVTLQQMLELDARGGTRYVEYLKAH